MLDSIFMQVLDMSKTASIVILVVLLARLLLKKVPKVFSYALWAVVLFRLLCPFTFEVTVSIMPEMASVSQDYSLSEAPISVLGAAEAAYHAVGDALNGGLGVQDIRTTEKDEEGRTKYVGSLWWEVWILFGQYVWVAGMGVMLLYSAVSYLKIRKKLLVVVPLRDNIFLADDINSPFVVGLFRPKIYLPCNLEEKEQEYIILHEQYHIKRLDHIIKALAFLALAIHWFNPLVWVAFILASKDMEMSCDEAVIGKIGDDVRADYSASLLTLATGRRIIAGTPLAFGEGDTKGRIRNLANWHKPAFWVVLVAVIACIALSVGLLTNATRNNNSDDSFFLLIGADGVHSIEISGANTSGGVVNADGATFEKGEKVWLEPLQGVTDLRGYSITALGKNGEVLYTLSIPENTTDAEVINLVGSDEWLLAPTVYERSFSDVAINTYVYEYSDIIGRFYIALKEDGSFTYQESAYSSYLGIGTWELVGDLITMTEKVHVGEIHINRINHLKRDGDDLVYVAKDSSNFPHVKLDDGDRFHCTDEAFNVEAPQRANANQTDASGTTKAPSIPVTWTYSPMMSATWHTAFYFEFAFDYTHIEANCDQGELWNLHGEEQAHNTEMQFEAMRPVCWTPSMNNSLAEKANVDFTVYDDEAKLYTGRIEIKKRGGEGGQTVYEARLVNSPNLYMLCNDSGFGAKIITAPTYDAMTSPDTVIWIDADLDHDGRNETIHVRELYDAMAYELSVVKQDGTILWCTMAHQAHTGWNSILLYEEDGKDYLLRYMPVMYQGVGNYTWAQFFFEGGYPKEVASMNVDFELPTEINNEMRAFAEKTNPMLKDSTVLLTTEQGLAVIGPKPTIGAPQIYAVYFDPNEIVWDIAANAPEVFDVPESSNTPEHNAEASTTMLGPYLFDLPLYGQMNVKDGFAKHYAAGTEVRISGEWRGDYPLSFLFSGEYTSEDVIAVVYSGISKTITLPTDDNWTCSVSSNGGRTDGNFWLYVTDLTVTSFEIANAYDMNHNGILESCKITWGPDAISGSGDYRLSIMEEGAEIWRDYAGTSHAGWNSIFAVKVDGEDYLLRYVPDIGTGIGWYMYELFSLDENGEEVLLKSNEVEFDLNFGGAHQSFDPATIAAFLEDVHSMLNGESELLLSTDRGRYRSGGSGATFDSDKFWGDSFDNSDKSLEEILRIYEEEMSKVQR